MLVSRLILFILNNFTGNIFDKEIKKMIRTNNSHKHKTLKLN